MSDFSMSAARAMIVVLDSTYLRVMTNFLKKVIRTWVSTKGEYFLFVGTPYLDRKIPALYAVSIGDILAATAKSFTKTTTFSQDYKKKFTRVAYWNHFFQGDRVVRRIGLPSPGLRKLPQGPTASLTY